MSQANTFGPAVAARVLEPAPAPSAAGRPLASQNLFVLVILAAQMMVVLDATIVNVALPHIRAALGFSEAGLSWVLNAYVLTFGGLLLLGARSGDLQGRRRTFLSGIALFSLCSMLGGFAGSPWQLLAARAFQGVGAAFAAPPALGLLPAAFPEGRERARAIALYTTVAAGGGAIGVVAGGLITEWLSWRWVMFVNVPIGAAVLLLGSSVVAETPRRPGQFDMLGALASTAGMTGVVLGLVEAGNAGWLKPLTLGPLAAGVALLALFVLNERRALEPILPLRLFANLTRSSANVARGLVYAGMYGTLFFMSAFLQDVQGYSPLASGLMFLPASVSVFCSSQLAGRLLARGLPPKALMLAGAAVDLASLLLASDLGSGASAPLVVANFVLLGAGMGLSLVSMTSASLAGVEPADAGAASGLVNVVQQLGAALGLAVLVTVYSDASHGGLATKLVLHGLHEAFFAGTVFAGAAIALVALGVRVSARRPRAKEG